ncbi:hypothetical protein BKA58DRAFT_50571 [Alternaria rosae]|uniref:uncharacterized protein n=1 Tax=Alternaria rosae TaxID=1187941 RepID=UPI001E8ED249|nr:uncharacterized protein BKA58DRAFT_50571 [Alternaria rosae]KAH6858917.1 hypothetical protein BKA58DRAFT_50571 [Alternaria rosae]
MAESVVLRRSWISFQHLNLRHGDHVYYSMVITGTTPIISRIGHTTAKNTQSLLSPGKKSPPMDMIPATTDKGTKSVPNTVSQRTELACALLACASLSAITWVYESV